jgi:glucose/arabinose dehydrogenase
VTASSFVLVMALAAGSPAAASTLAAPQAASAPAPKTPAAQAPQTPAQPPATTPAAGQTPATTTTTGPAPAVPASRKFTSDAGMVFSVIKADKTADFEAVMARVKEALGKSDKPERKQQALSWLLYKGLETPGGTNVLYVWYLNPPVKDAEYSVTDILREAFPNEAQDLWAKYTACFVSGQTMLNLSQVLSMSPAVVPK